MEERNRLCRAKKLEFTLSINMLKIIFLFLKAPQVLPKVPATFLNAKRNQNLTDSENIWAFIEGSEKQMRY
jgi:hypothetical protein